MQQFINNLIKYFLIRISTGVELAFLNDPVDISWLIKMSIREISPDIWIERLVGFYEQILNIITNRP